jgi:hypothetical protein
MLENHRSAEGMRKGEEGKGGDIKDLELLGVEKRERRRQKRTRYARSVGQIEKSRAPRDGRKTLGSLLFVTAAKRMLLLLFCSEVAERRPVDEAWPRGMNEKTKMASDGCRRIPFRKRRQK